MNIRKKGLIVLVIMIFFLFMGAASAASPDKNVNLNDKRFTTVNIPFIENHGQITDKSVKYSANTFIGNVYVKDNGIVYNLNKNKKAWVVSEKFSNANNVAVKGINPTKTKINYYKGKIKETNLPTYSMVKYSNLYKGINLYLRAHGKNIEKIFVLSSQGSPSNIIISVSGSKKLLVNKKGELEILNGTSALVLTKPVAYQIINGEKVNVKVSYITKNSLYGFKLGKYNKNYKLIIDPLLSSTFLGGVSYDNAQDVAVDKAGNIYVTGYTGSSDFPNTGSQIYNQGLSSEWDAFVSKFDSNLGLVSSTFIGGSMSDKATGIALDNSGNAGCNVFITGTTYSTGLSTANDFPTTMGSFKVNWDVGAGDVFITKLNNNLGLVASSVFGGNQSDMSNGIVIDASNNIYIAGSTYSYLDTNKNKTSFPIQYSLFNEPDLGQTYTGNGDVFVSKLDNNLQWLRSGVVFGGSGTSYASSIAIDQSNYVYITGATNATDFPLVNTKDPYPNNGLQNNKGNYDAFVIKLSNQYLENIEGVALLGGSNRDTGNSITVDPLGRVYVVGGTWSTNMFTTTGARQRQNNGKQDAFLTVMDKQIQNVLSSTYLGGNGNDVANDVFVADQGTIGIVGTTNSTNFYNDLSTGDTTPHGMEDVFFSAFNNPMTAQERVETTLLGGANADYGQGAAIDQSGYVYLVGDTWSNDYPTTIGTYKPYAPDVNQYVDDAFVSKINNLYDMQAPVVGPTDPVNNAVDVPINKVIKIVFSEKILPGSAYGLITLQHGGISTAITKAIVGNTLVIMPSAQLLGNTNYILTIPVNAIQDFNGNIADAYALNFKTYGLDIIGAYPANNANNIVGNTPIIITFNHNIKPGTTYNLITLTNAALVPISITKTISGNVLTINPVGNLIPDTYTLTLPANSIFDMSNTGTTDFSSKFTVTPPTEISTDPVYGAVNVATNKVIAVKFSRPIKAGNLSISLIGSNGIAIPITFSISNDVLYIYHTTRALTTNTLYTLTLNPNCILDLAGNGVQATYVTKFKTEASPTVSSTNPVNNAVNVATNKVITVKFSKPIKAGNLSITLKASNGTKIPITFSISNNILYIYHSSKRLSKNTTYTLTLNPNCITDQSGNGLQATYATKFRTGSV